MNLYFEKAKETLLMRKEDLTVPIMTSREILLEMKGIAEWVKENGCWGCIYERGKIHYCADCRKVLKDAKSRGLIE